MDGRSSNVQTKSEDPEIEIISSSSARATTMQQQKQASGSVVGWQGPTSRPNTSSVVASSSSDIPPRTANALVPSNQGQFAPLPIIDTATVQSLPPTVVQYVQGLVQHKEQLLQIVRSQDKKYAGLLSSWRDYQEANSAYQQEHDRHMAKVAELTQEVEKQKTHANKGWQACGMWKQSYDEVNGKLTAAKADADAATTALNKARLEGSQWRNCAVAWSSPDSDYQKSLVNELGKKLYEQYAQKEKLANDKIRYLESVVLQQQALLGNTPRQNVAGPSSRQLQQSSSLSTMPSPQFVGQFPTPAPLQDPNPPRRHSTPIGYHTRPQPPPINTMSSAAHRSNQSPPALTPQFTTAPSSAVQSPAALSPSSIFPTLSSMVSSIAKMEIGWRDQAEPQAQRSSGSTSTATIPSQASPPANSGSCPSLGPRPATSQAIHPPQPRPGSSSARHPGLCLPPSQLIAGPSTQRPRQASVPNAPTVHSTQSLPALSLPPKPSGVFTLPPKLPAARRSLATPMSQADGVPNANAWHSRVSAPSGSTDVVVAPRLRPAKRPSSPIKMEEVDEPFQQLQLPAAKKPRVDSHDSVPGSTSAVLAVTAVSSAPTIPAASSRPIPTLSPAQLLSQTTVRSESAHSLPPIATLEEPVSPGSGVQLMDIDTSGTISATLSSINLTPAEQAISNARRSSDASVATTIVDSPRGSASADARDAAPTVGFDQDVEVKVERDRSAAGAKQSAPEPGEVDELKDSEASGAVATPAALTEPEEGEILGTPQTVVNDLPPSMTGMDLDTKTGIIEQANRTPPPSTPGPSVQGSTTPQATDNDDETEPDDSPLSAFLGTVFEVIDGSVVCNLCSGRVKQESPSADEPQEDLSIGGVDTLVEHCKRNHLRVFNRVTGAA